MYLQTIDNVGIENNFGSVLLGGLAAIWYGFAIHYPLSMTECLTTIFLSLSGVLGNQCAQYFRVFSADKLSLKLMVCFISTTPCRTVKGLKSFLRLLRSGI
jgi:hypothetical protein